MSYDAPLRAWAERPLASRQAILAELKTVISNWRETANSPETFEDVETLETVVVILESVEPPAQDTPR
jgi:hypothetical protein